MNLKNQSQFEKLKIDHFFVFGMIAGFFIANFIEPTITFALPWDGPLQTLEDSLTGTVATAITAITVCVTGMMIAMGEGGAAGRVALRLIFGLALAIGFTQIISIFR